MKAEPRSSQSAYNVEELAVLWVTRPGQGMKYQELGISVEHIECPGIRRQTCLSGMTEIERRIFGPFGFEIPEEPLKNADLTDLPVLVHYVPKGKHSVDGTETDPGHGDNNITNHLNYNWNWDVRYKHY